VNFHGIPGTFTDSNLECGFKNVLEEGETNSRTLGRFSNPILRGFRRKLEQVRETRGVK